MTSIDFSSARTRASRGRAIVVGTGESMRELTTALRRAMPRVSECTDLYRAIDDVGSSSAREPVALVVIAADCEGFDPAACADAFRRVDPTVQLVLAVSRSQEDAVAGAIAEGFEDSLSIPPDVAEIRAVLDTLGLSEPARRPRDGAEHATSEPPRVPEVRNVVEIAIKDAQARASAASDPSPDAAGLPSAPSVSAATPASTVAGTAPSQSPSAPSSPMPQPPTHGAATHAAISRGARRTPSAAAGSASSQEGRSPNPSTSPPASPSTAPRTRAPKSTFTMPSIRHPEGRRATDGPPGVGWTAS